MPDEKLDIKRSPQSESEAITSSIPSKEFFPFLSAKDTMSFFLASKNLARQAGIMAAKTQGH